MDVMGQVLKTVGESGLKWLVFSVTLLILAACRKSEVSSTPSTIEVIDQPGDIPTITLPATFTPPVVEPTSSLATGGALECRVDLDCVLVIRTDSCCSCPEVMSRASLLSAEPLILYEPGQSYGDMLPDACANVACESCLPPPIPICGDDGRCKAQSSPEIILQGCPDCFEQAALAAIENGDVVQAVGYCNQADVDACLLSLFSVAIARGDYESALRLCLEPAHPDPGGCLATVAPILARENSQRAVDLCQQITTTDVRQFGCMLDVATIVHALNPEEGQTICQLLSGERVGQCLEELEN